MVKAKDTVLDALAVTSPAFALARLIAKSVSVTIGETGSASAENAQALDALKVQAEKQDIELGLAEAQARVAQELAIAGRIENAEEVEIEEYYEGSAEGHLGARMENGAIGLGAGGSGRRVVKRIYRFKGFDPAIGAITMDVSTK